MHGGGASPVLDADGILAWVRTAKAGDAIVYARGEAPPRPTAEVANLMQDQGLIDLTRRREGPRRFQFIIQRRAKPFSALRARAPRFGRASAETVILRMIRDAIRRGQPCPTNAEFAAAAGLSGRLAASYRLRRLVAAGTIKLLDYGPYEHRVAVLVATGQATVRAKL